MAKSRRSQYKLLRSTDNPAVTQFFSWSVAEGLRLYLLKPHSGKTHQLRVALSSLGVPILGDTLYGGSAVDADRGYLHAYALEFEWRGQTLRYLSLPSQGDAFLQRGVLSQMQALAEPWTLDWPKRK